ncbi:MAG: hypothetical protein MZU84_00690 [Sphingobacterium sp.]|nr:hypothetical protein [Sphingobacterium sp.]
MLLLVTAAFPPLSSFFAVILEHLARFTLSFTGMISSMNHGVIMNIGMSSVETLLLTAASALLLASLLRVQKMTLKPFTVTMLLLIVMQHGQDNTGDAPGKGHRLQHQGC